MTETRTDIQALRGLAVLLVVLYHTHVGVLSAGYLGVDVFFVISGFLITGLVKSAIERRDFRFSEFYFRRAKRLLPAAYLTFIATAVLAPLLLGTSELRDFGMQMIGAVTFTGNIVFWQQSGYFAGAAELKPLLHVWSLAIEEQYYLILPAAMVLIPIRYWLVSATIVLFASLGLWVIGSYLKPIATFYLLPTRGWELALGSVGTLISPHNRLRELARVLFVPALFALFAIPFYPVGASHPGPDAIIVCVATLIVILCNHPWTNVTLPARALAGVGDFSYSLYLVHWPIFAYANNAWAGDPPGELPHAARIAGFVLSMALGYALYRYVELPVRRIHLRPSRRMVGATLAASLGLVVIGAGIMRVPPAGVDYAQVRRTNFGFGAACESRSPFVPNPECRNSERPSILVWGDSFAMHLVPGIVATSGSEGVAQATRSACGPLLDLAPIARGLRSTGTDYNRDWAESCIAFNQSVVDYLAATPSIDLVVLSTPLRQYLDPSQYRSLVRHGDDWRIVDPSADVALEGLRRTVSSIRSMGKRVVLVAPPPSGGFDIGACLERRAEGKLMFGAPSDCQVPVRDYQQSRRGVLELLARVPAEVDLGVFRFDPLLCDATTCKTSIGDTFIYRDPAHFSYAGSQMVAERVGLASRLRSLAR